MAILHLDGFDGASDTTGNPSNPDTEAYLEARYNHSNWRPSSRPEVFTGWGGVGKALCFGSGVFGGNHYIQTTIPESQTIYCGFAFRPHQGLLGNAWPLMQWKHVVDEVLHVEAELFGGSHINFLLNGGTIIATAYNVCRPGRWAYFEFKVIISDTVGVIEMYSNGIEVLNETGLDTRFGGSGDYIDTIRLIGVDGATPAEPDQGLYDDYYIVDDTGSNNVDFLGPIKVEEILPNGAGDSTDFTPSAGSNYQNVSETPRDDNTTYNEDTISTNKDLFTASNLVTIDNSIFGIMVNALGVVTATMPYTLVTKIKQSTSEDTGTAVAITNTGKYIAVSDVFEQDPAAGPGDWTVATINTMQFGYEVG